MAILIAALVLMIGSTVVLAEGGKYRITDQEQAACSADAVRLCSDAYPDQDKLLVCLKANRSQLGDGCGIIFDAGLKRRHL